MKRPRLTIRTRLTLVYGGLFLLAGVVLLGTTYLLVRSQSQVLPPEKLTVSGTIEGGTVGLGPSVDAKDYVTQVTNDARQDALNAVLTQGGIALAVVGAAAIAIGWLIAGRLLQPLQQMTDTARRIAEAPAADRGLRERITVDGPSDEIRRLADTFNVMLERLDNSFDSQRRFIANASHELRTPLTLNRALIEVALHRTTASPDVRQLGETLLSINVRHERLIEGLLLLARSEREPAEHAYVDLADIADHVVGQAPNGTVRVSAETAEAPTAGNPVLLERLVQNLVDNAVRHNVADGGWVRVSTGSGPAGTVTLRVSNTGPVVPRYEVPNLFEPFRRLGSERLATNPAGAGSTEPTGYAPAPAGAGLGLSIVRAVANAHGGDVHAEPRDGGGLEVTVTLPAASRVADA
jgi:signal transduction histidine kinase